MSSSPSARPDEPGVPTWAAGVASVSALGVLAYVAAWAVAGVLTPDYDPLRQAISELFAQGAPAVPRGLVVGALVATGVALLAYAPALDRGLPGEGLAGPVLVAASGVGTIAVVAFPCTAGCPGFGTTFTDSMHTLTAGFGYLTLILAPLVFARRVRGHDDRFAAVSLVLGGIALAGLVIRYGGIVTALGGLQQRVLNTTADAWYVVAALVILRRWRTGR